VFRDTKQHADVPWSTRVAALAAALLVGIWVAGHGQAQAAEPVIEEAPAASERPPGIDLAYVAPDAVAIKLFRPAAILAQPELNSFRELVVQASKLATGLEIGLDQLEQITRLAIGLEIEWDQLEQVTWMVLGPREHADGGEPDPSELIVLILQAGRAHDFAGFINRWIDDAAPRKLEGQRYFVGEHNGTSVAYFRPDERTAIFGSEDAVCRVITAPRGRRPEFLSPEVVAEFRDDHFFAAGWSAVIDFILKSPELALARTAAAPLSPLWRNTNSFAYGLRFEERLDEHFVLFAKDEKGAARVEETLQALTVLERNMADGLREKVEGTPPWIESLQAIVVDLLDDDVNNTEVERSGKVVRVKCWIDL
jgi:hypothetical protein